MQTSTSASYRGRESAYAAGLSAEKYLTFHLGSEEFAIPVLKVREIMRVQEVTSVPQTPPWVKGVLNLRGKVIPVVDLRVKFRLPTLDDAQRNCIIVVEVAAEGQVVLVGAIVDAVSEVIAFTQADVDPPPDFGDGVSMKYLLGLAKNKGKVKALIDIDHLLSSSELASLESTIQ
jgi:purine-binding chemotaxis protein CheW